MADTPFRHEGMSTGRGLQSFVSLFAMRAIVEQRWFGFRVLFVSAQTTQGQGYSVGLTYTPKQPTNTCQSTPQNPHSEVLSKMYDSDDFEEPHVPLLSFEEWRRNYRPHPKPTPTSASSQSSKRSGRRQLDPYEQLSLVNLARQHGQKLSYEYDQKAVDIAIAHDFEEKHGWRLKSVRSELLDLALWFRPRVQYPPILRYNEVVEGDGLEQGSQG
jgi:hypothetical protein